MSHPFFDGLLPTLAIAHRGGAALAPENTLLAFRGAVDRCGAQMLELDVQRTLDGALVVAHDPTVDRCTEGSGPIAGLRLLELSRLDAGFRFTRDGRSFPFRGQGARVPTLVEVLRAFPSVRLNLELKPDAADAAEALVALLREERALPRVCLGSEDDAVGARLHRATPDACHFYPRDALAAFVLAVKSGEAPPDDERYAVLDMPHSFQEVPLFDAALRDEAARRGKWINVWTVDDPAQMRELISLGAGGIMTDRPDLLRAALDGSR